MRSPGLTIKAPELDTAVHMTAMVWCFEGRVALAVHGAAAPSRLEWAGYIRDTLAHGDISALRVFIVSYGGGPDGTQRKQLTDALKQPAPTALLSASLVVRSLVNALSWFNPKMRAFGLNEDASACDFLGLLDEERGEVRRLRARLEQQLTVASAQS